MATQWQQPPQPPTQPPHYHVPSPFHQQPPHYQQSPNYHQPGLYAQSGRYQQPVQYAQSQQHSPNQQHRPQQQGYSGYQQQYAPQQYPSQHAPPAQSSPPQYGASQQPYQQPSNSTYGQPTSQIARPQACYNCASPNHFAQDCPEPKREVPAGALDPVRFANPLKRPRPGNTVVTRYQSAPQNQAHASPHGYGSAWPPPGQAGYSQYQAGQSPATPTVAQSPGQQQHVQQQWQQYYQYQQAYQQGNYNQQGVSYQQHQYQSPSTPAGEFANGSQQPNQASPQTPQNGSTPQMYQVQYPQIQLPQPHMTSAALCQHTQQQFQNSIDPTTFVHKHQSGSFIEPNSSLIRVHQGGDADAEADEDNLNLLDIPSVPPSPNQPGTYTYLPNTLVSPPVNLLCMPLPANFVVADTLYPIAPPAPEMEGRCQSKYFRDNNLILLKENIRESKYWKDHKDDPIFSGYSKNDSVVSLDELFSKIKERHVNGDLSEDPMRSSRSLSRSVSVRQNSGDFRGDLETLERDLAKLRAEMERKERLARSKHSSPPQSVTSEKFTVEKVVVKQEEMPPQSAFSEKAPMSAQETEDVLASLGVTGPPKPIMRPLRTSIHGSPDDNIRSLSRSSSKAEISLLPKDHQTNGSPQYPQGYVPPPPPPPPYRQHSFPEGANGSPLSAPPLYMNSYSCNANAGEYGNGPSEYGPDAQFTSPTELHSERSRSRKRSYTRRGSISDEETPARRQEDDIAPKHKRRAPKVQEAYGRRW